VPLHFARTVEPLVPASMSVEQLTVTVAWAGAAPAIPAAIMSVASAPPARVFLIKDIPAFLAILLPAH
jgi:hypothetical protein